MLERLNEKLDYIQKTWQNNGLAQKSAVHDQVELLCSVFCVFDRIFLFCYQ